MAVTMDVLALNLKTGCLSPVSGRNPRPTATWQWSTRIVGGLTGKSRKSRSLSLAVVCASGKKKSNDPSFSGNGDPLVPGGDGPEVPKKPHEKSEPYEPESYRVVSDWRDFRANLVAREQDILFKPEQQPESGPSPTLPKGSSQISPVWAHPIPMPENGCLLIATEKIDNINNFQRTVILLLGLGSPDPLGHGPFGLILNRPLNQKVKETDIMYPSMEFNFGDHQLHFGGPLHPDATMFLVKTGGGLIGIALQSGFQQVVSGVHFGGEKRMQEATALVQGGVLSPDDFKFFAGYSCWTYDQLLDEIKKGYWVVAACSAHVIGRAVTGTSDQMWQEVLEMLGGPYADLSRKARLDEPKQD